ncbi:MAG: hypothetical protein K9H64_07590 [Bacteroidales bacterium]|nr:hypothetical protein [Bacteroidales bacterium]MCF8455596.1 hypothetical protein [Bacteroidales bacterium]
MKRICKTWLNTIWKHFSIAGLWLRNFQQETSIQVGLTHWPYQKITTQNFVCIEPQKKKLVLFLKLNPDEIEKMPQQARDVRNIGHFATGDLEYSIKSYEDFEMAKPFINQSLKNIGG